MLCVEWILAKNPILYHIFPQAKVKYRNVDRSLAIFSQKKNTGEYVSRAGARLDEYKNVEWAIWMIKITL
jgi:hypothetical protein